MAVAFNDVDLCMKITKAGYRIVYNPAVELYHYESKSRGNEDTKAKVARFEQEVALFRERWPEILENGDPYYNPNFTLRRTGYALREKDEPAQG
jgi:GT2 family glycosyltransferase